MTTLLGYDSKYIVTSASQFQTSSTSLVDDSYASQGFSLDSARTVLVIYAPHSNYGDTEPTAGFTAAISIDGADHSLAKDSGNSTGKVVRNCVFWVGTLGAGSHTITGRLAANAASTATISNRILLILILTGDAFSFVENSTSQACSQTGLIDDSYAQVTFTPPGSCKALVLYCASNDPGDTENAYGKKAAVNIAGADYGQVDKSPYGTNAADSLFTCHGIALTAVSTTVKGRFGNAANSTTTVTVHRRHLGVLLFQDGTLMDVVTSTTQVSTTSNSLVDDGQATINRTTTDGRCLLVVAAGTKRYNTSSSYGAERYGIGVDSVDQIWSRGCGYNNAYANSMATAWAQSLTAASHTVQGRFSNNYSTNSAKIDARQVVALWIPVETITYVNVSESGTGAEAIGVAVDVPVSESGASTDTVAGVQASVDIAETGQGSENEIIGGAIDVVESGIGSDTVVDIAFSISDSGAGTETPILEASIPSAESGVGVEVPSVASTLTVEDGGIGTDYATMTWTIEFHETGVGVEFAWRIKDSVLLDSTSLPHVLSIKITDEAQMSDKKIQGGSLPRRKMVGKPGRVVEIQGWSDSQSELDAMDALADGSRRTFIHPSGDSFAVIVTGFDYDRTADQYTRRDYRTTLKETR